MTGQVRYDDVSICTHHPYPYPCRRDLGVLLLHQGRLAEAWTELQTYMKYAASSSRADPFDLRLCQQLVQMMQQVEGLQPASGGVLTVERVLWLEDEQAAESARAQAEEEEAKAMRPLTW